MVQGSSFIFSGERVFFNYSVIYFYSDLKTFVCLDTIAGLKVRENLKIPYFKTFFQEIVPLIKIDLASSVRLQNFV